MEVDEEFYIRQEIEVIFQEVGLEIEAFLIIERSLFIDVVVYLGKYTLKDILEHKKRYDI